MKKLFYILALVLFCSLTFTACSDEEITPDLENGGGRELNSTRD